MDWRLDAATDWSPDTIGVGASVSKSLGSTSVASDWKLDTATDWRPDTIGVGASVNNTAGSTSTVDLTICTLFPTEKKK